jgi:hypothetical protein
LKRAETVFAAEPVDRIDESLFGGGRRWSR